MKKRGVAFKQIRSPQALCRKELSVSPLPASSSQRDKERQTSPRKEKGVPIRPFISRECWRPKQKEKDEANFEKLVLHLYNSTKISRLKQKQN
jgi:hypothetical protein